MKLYRFHASNMQKAIYTVTETLGPNALIYSTRKIANGMEVLAGLPYGADVIIDHPNVKEEIVEDKEYVEEKPCDEVKIKDAATDNHILEALSLQMKMMSENVQMLTSAIETLQNTYSQGNTFSKFAHVMDWIRYLLHEYSLTKLFIICNQSLSQGITQRLTHRLHQRLHQKRNLTS